MVNRKSSSSKMPEEDSILQTEVSKEFLNFLIEQLKDTYWAEKHLTKALPKMRKVATTASLKDAFTSLLVTTQLHVERLEQVFELLGETPRASKCEAMASLVEEGNGIIIKTKKGAPIRDTGLLIAAQKIENYEIATYGALVQLARTMGNEDVISLLEETLREEKDAGELLTALAEGATISSVASEGVEKQRIDVEKVVEVYDSVNLTRKTTKK